MRSKNGKKVGIKKYIFMAIIYGLLIVYCLDMHLTASLWVPVIQLLMMITAGMIRRETFPIGNAYRFSSLPGWLLAISLILIIPFSYLNDYDYTNQYVRSNMKQTFVWPDSGLALVLPEPITNSGRIYENNELEFRVDMYNVSRTRYNSYIKACKRKGFDDVNYEFDSSFSALNEEGYDLYCYLDDHGEMSLTLRSPRKLAYIEWPDNELLELLPQPDSTYGRIDADRSGYAALCIGSIWDDTFKEYTAACREAGFKKNYERKADMYQANDEEGNLLLLDYDEEMHVMYIQIWSAEEIAKYDDSSADEADEATDSSSVSAEDPSDEETTVESSSGENETDEDSEEEETPNKRGSEPAV